MLTCLYTSSFCLLLVRKGSVTIYNVFILEFCNLYISDLRLLVVERVSTCQYNRLKIPFVVFSQTAGTRLYRCRRQFDLNHLTFTEEYLAGRS